ncbi:MAG: hypothetical protein PARBB_00897 [Parabacteroides distasonis]
MPIKFKLIERKDWSKDAPEGARKTPRGDAR